MIKQVKIGAPTGSLLFRRLAVVRIEQPSRACRFPICDTADCQSALRRMQ